MTTDPRRTSLSRMSDRELYYQFNNINSLNLIVRGYAIQNEVTDHIIWELETAICMVIEEQTRRESK